MCLTFIVGRLRLLFRRNPEIRGDKRNIDEKPFNDPLGFQSFIWHGEKMKGIRELYLVCYDIQDTNVRNRLLYRLKSFSVSSQKSVFECLFTYKELQDFCKYTDKAIDKKTDNVRIFRLDPRCRTEYLGKAVRPDMNVILVG